MSITAPEPISISALEEALEGICTKVPELNPDLVLLGNLIHLLQTKINSSIDGYLKKYGLSISSWYGLWAIYSRPENELQPSEMSKILNLSRTSITRLSDEMVEKGWLIRYAQPEDRRKVTLKLTHTAEKLLKETLPVVSDIRNKIWSELEVNELQELKRLLLKTLMVKKSTR
ncbi:MarR family winged helix-turn-helix transcriptional regulator [Pelistega europaea]|uniref:MarR family transcriptional regulator n=1 Tax=Pelistega europaea TaxID=106147 RepID=A0A7Y4L890_9BURK|nr:MarR family transcriptional regulator [Pelistega europaea]NOL48753.1 MarR family transcriptional regulator [Pelistega europaea]